MKHLPKVVGLSQVNNEWPLLAISVSNALFHHVDEVYLLNHFSTDDSQVGIERLQKLWKDRLHVLDCNDQTFLQEASTNALIEISQNSSPDWIYVFDADEFLMSHTDKTLKKILSSIDPKYAAIRYEVHNWISTEDFDESNLDHYKGLCYRSVPTLFMGMEDELFSDDIKKGNINFFDMSFRSKVIFRNEPMSWLGVGSHSLKSDAGERILDIDSEQLSAAHFPFLTKNRLTGKAKQGEMLIQAGFPPGHGWQSQMIFRISLDKKLDDFWKSLSINIHPNGSNRKLPSFVIDDRFSRSIEPILSFLAKEFDFRIHLNASANDITSRKLVDTEVPFRALVHLTRKFQVIADLNRQKCDLALSERDIALAHIEFLKKTESSRFTRPFSFLSRLAQYVTTLEGRQCLARVVRYYYDQLPLPKLFKRRARLFYNKVVFKFFRKP